MHLPLLPLFPSRFLPPLHLSFFPPAPSFLLFSQNSSTVSIPSQAESLEGRPQARPIHLSPFEGSLVPPSATA